VEVVPQTWTSPPPPAPIVHASHPARPSIPSSSSAPPSRRHLRRRHASRGGATRTTTMRIPLPWRRWQGTDGNNDDCVWSAVQLLPLKFPPDMSSEEGDICRRAGAVALNDEYDGRCNLDGGLALFVGWTKPLSPKWRRTGRRWDRGSGGFAHHVI
jgi:hypothetical protein